MVELLGPGHAAECTTFVAMVIESAAVYTTFALLFLIPFLVNNPVSYTFLQVIGEAQVSRLIASRCDFSRSSRSGCARPVDRSTIDHL